jgi:L-alanine-DL-glutamate epimerase-like enolase superfamily enzyme
MKITDVRTAVVRGQRDWVLVRVYTDEGITGLGEAFFGVGVAEIINGRVRQNIIGENPLDVDRLYHLMLDPGGGASHHTNVGGTAVMAISGVEIALWDLAGKAMNVPIYRLLGGKYRDKLRMYPDVGQGDVNEPESWAHRAKEVAGEGYTIAQFDINGKAKELQLDPYEGSISRAALRKITRLVAAAREGLGDDVELAINCHGKFNVASALRIADALAPFDLFWLAQPVPPENIDALARVASRSPIPICVGQSYYKKDGFRELLAKGACHILIPSVHKCGGLLEGKIISAMADVEQVPVCFQATVSPVGMMAAAHLAASIRNFLMLEIHHDRTDVAWYQDLIKWDKPLVSKGYLRLPDGPGLGVELDEDVVREHLKPGTGFFEPGGY